MLGPTLGPWLRLNEDSTEEPGLGFKTEGGFREGTLLENFLRPNEGAEYLSDTVLATLVFIFVLSKISDGWRVILWFKFVFGLLFFSSFFSEHNLQLFGQLSMISLTSFSL